MKHYSSVTLHVSPKQIEALHFRNGFHDKSAQADCSKEMLVPILNGLKDLNTVFIK